jgi:hypothetical protein
MNKVKVFNINTHESQIYDSVTKASEATGRGKVSISRVLAGVTRKSGVYWFTYDLAVDKMPILRPDKRFIDFPNQTNTKKEIISNKVDKETAKLEYQKIPVINNKELAAKAKRIYVEDGKTVIYLKPSRDQWSHLDE